MPERVAGLRNSDSGERVLSRGENFERNRAEFPYVQFCDFIGNANYSRARENSSPKYSNLIYIHAYFNIRVQLIINEYVITNK